jgi:hypothetical protein
MSVILLRPRSCISAVPGLGRREMRRARGQNNWWGFTTSCLLERDSLTTAKGKWEERALFIYEIFKGTISGFFQVFFQASFIQFPDYCTVQPHIKWNKGLGSYAGQKRKHSRTNCTGRKPDILFSLPILLYWQELWQVVFRLEKEKVDPLPR